MSKSGFKKGRLGIGTDNPRYPLDVVGDIRLTGGFRDASGNDFNFLAINNQDILKTPDIAGITCVNSKVGIFNVNPSEQLDVSGNINFTGILKQDGVEFGGGVFNGVQYISGSNVSIYISGDDTTHANATGQGNVSLGTGCLTSIALGQENIAIGKDSLNSVTNTSNNIAIGSEALESCISNYNIGIGYLSGRYITSGSNNIAIGFSSMDRQDVGDSNVAIGEESLYYFNNGSGNVALGKKALYGNMSNSGGNHNIGIGSLAGLAVKNGNKNICIGYFAGPTDAMKDYHERLYIDKGRNGTDSFIYGHMDSTNPILAFNANVGIGKDSPGEHLDVSGNINFTGTLKQDGVEFGGGKFEDGTTSGQIYYNGGNVGIGTTSPNYKLEVEMSGGNGGLRVKNTTNSAEAVIWTEPDYASYLYFGANNANKWSISSRASGEGYDLKFYRFNPGALEVMTMDYATGNVGIGTDSPQSQLQIGDFTGTPHLTLAGKNNSATSSGIYFTDNDAGENPINYGMGIQFDSLNNILNIIGDDNGDGTTDKLMTIMRANGNVGIGTTSPDTLLHIQKSDTGYAHNTDALIVLERNDGDNNWINFVTKDGEEAGLLFASSTANAHGGVTYRNTDGMTFRTGGNNVRMAIDETGNVGIGTTTPGYKLHIVNPTLNNSIQDLLCLETHANSQTTIGPAILFRERWNNGSYWNLARILAMEQAGYGGQLAFFTNLGNTGADDTLLERMRIDENGNVGIGTTDPTAGLDVFSNGSVLTNTAYKTKSWAQMKTEIESQGGSMATRDQILSLQSSILLSGQDKWAPGVTRLGGGEAYKQWYQIGNSNHVYGREHPGYPSWGDGTTSYGFRDTAAIVSKPLKINHGFFINHYEDSAAWGQAVFQMVAASTNYCTMGFTKGTDSGSNDNVLEAISFTRNGKVGINNSDKLYHSLNITGQGNLWDKSPAILFVDDHYTKNWYVGTANNSAEGDFYIRIKSTWDSNPSATGIKLTYAGKLYISSSVHASSSVGSSDDRIKHNEKPITNAMDIINKLTTKKYFKSTELHEANYDYTLDESGNPITTDTYMTEIGFVAQEVEKIPELNFCVEGEPTYIDNMTGEEKPQVLGLSYTNIFSLNVAATQELHKENQALKKEVNELKTIVHALKNHLGLA